MCFSSTYTSPSSTYNKVISLAKEIQFGTRLTHDSWTEDQCVAAATATTPLTGEALNRRDRGGRPSGSVVLVATEGALLQRCSEGLFGGFNGGSVDLFGIGPFRHFQTFPDIFTLFSSLFGLLN